MSYFDLVFYPIDVTGGAMHAHEKKTPQLHMYVLYVLYHHSYVQYILYVLCHHSYNTVGYI